MSNSRLSKNALETYRRTLVESGFTEREADLIARAATHPRRGGRGSVKMQAAGDGKSAEMFIYGAVGFDPWEDAVTLSSFAAQLRDLGDIETIDLHINSPGGDVFEGVAIGNLLTQHKARKIVHIDGLAASIASVIAMSGDEIYIAENAAVMIHNAWGISVGDHRDMLDTAELLERLDGQIARTYAARTGRKDATFRALMAKETWFTGQEAVDAKLATKVMPAKKAAALAEFDLSGYRNAPAVESVAQTEDIEARKVDVATRLRLLELDAQEAV